MKRDVYEKIFSKIKKALQRGYLQPTKWVKVKNFIDYFGVVKAETDIRVVFNGTSCGPNDAVWAPNFWLPTSKSMTRILGYNFKTVDLDLGEMFLNFPLHPSLQVFSGVDLTTFKKDLEVHLPEIEWEDPNRRGDVWMRDWMGFAPSPEWSCRFYYFAGEFVRGNIRDIDNPLRCNKVILNLIGNKGYDPSLPNVFKWNKTANRIAGDILAYVDNLRVTGWSYEHAWQIARQTAARLQHLGIQDSVRKRRVDNGPWAGSIFLSSDSKIQKTVSQDKWTKGREYILELVNILAQNPQQELQFKKLEIIRGYLCHLAMTFEIIFPFLKGFHLTLCAHLPKRDEEGWKLSDLQWIGHIENQVEEKQISRVHAQELLQQHFDPNNNPNFVKPVKRFKTCLKALEKLFSSETPPVITERSTKIDLLVYGFADASKSGFWASLDYGKSIRYRIGVWGADEEEESSNYREFANIVETLEEEAANGLFYGGPKS